MENIIPKCVGVIMDGNRRWAKANGKISTEGHRYGYERLRKFLEWSRNNGIKTVIAYALSTENWKRSQIEINCLMDIFKYALTNEIEGLKKDKVAIRFIGEISRFPKDIADLMYEAEKETKKFTDLTLVLAVSYGGRAEILNAVRNIIKNKVAIDKLTEKDFSNYLWTNGIDEPEIIIRTGGEIRMSNFLSWQSTYSELFFTRTLWPDFDKNEYRSILEEFSKRKRNLGK